jgi:hypothetical protein
LNSEWLLKLIIFSDLAENTTSGGEVVVKHLLINSQQSIDESLNEGVLITNVKHKNLVKLKGCCLMGGGGANKRLLVYEFVDNNNLAETIFGNFFDL